MKKIKLPRKAKKLFKKEHLPEADLSYMAARIINEMFLEDQSGNKNVNYKKFYRKIETHPNGTIKKVLSYY